MDVTIKDVAKMAGVSPGTVSNYLNKKSKISEDKKKQIDLAIKTLGYARNEMARSLRTKKPKTIGVLIPSLANSTIMKMVSAIETNLKKEGYGLLVLSHNNNSLETEEAFEYLEQRVSGIIFNPTYDSVNANHDFLNKTNLKVPIVTFDNRLEDFECDSVLVDHKEVTRKAVLELIKRGHTHIGIIAGPSVGYIPVSRVLGYKEGILDGGLEICEKYIKHTLFSKKSGEKVIEELLIENPQITAIVVGSSRLTIGAISYLQKVSKYKDISVIGTDSFDFSNMVFPHICYVSQPIKQIGEFASMLILKRVNDDYDSFPTAIKLEAKIENLESLDFYKQVH